MGVRGSVRQGIVGVVQVASVVGECDMLVTSNVVKLSSSDLNVASTSEEWHTGRYYLTFERGDVGTHVFYSSAEWVPSPIELDAGHDMYSI
jgi:hypothetical protein